MPYLQQPNVGEDIPYGRSDHTIPIPRPEFDARLGVENACQKCHRDRPVQALEATVAEWYGTLKPHPAPVAALLAAEGAPDVSSGVRAILAAPSGHHHWAEFAGLSSLMLRYFRPDVGMLDGEAVGQLKERARSSDTDVRALALAMLHLSHGGDADIRRFLADELRKLGLDDRAIRKRWVWILRVRGDAYLGQGDNEAALAAYGKALEVRPDDPAVLRSLGEAHTRGRDYARAIELFSRSLAASPGEPQALVGLGFARMRLGDRDGAIAAYREAIAASPWDASAYANLGVAQLERGALGAAVAALEKAVELNPSLALAHFSLARAYADQGRLEEAAAALERGLAYDPGNAAARRALQAIRK
jgi:tetratricopeptide (TPR) repeat protein